MKRVLIIGGGGREHALAWKLRQEGHEIIAAPGNPGIAQLGRCVPSLDVKNHAAMADFVQQEQIDFTVVGPEAPLATGIVDHFRYRNLPIFGPSKAAAQIETSKTFCCKLLEDAGVPIPHTSYLDSFAHMKRTLSFVDNPERIVLKKSGLAAGKGAEVVRTNSDLVPALVRLEKIAGDDTFLVQYMEEGAEMSCFYLADGSDFVFAGTAQDYKPLYPGGSMTGGMGGFAPHPLLTSQLRLQADDMVRRILKKMAELGCPYTGVMYIQLMITSRGPVVIEINCRFGDPEAELLMPLLDCELLPLLMATANGTLRHHPEPRFKKQVSVGIVISSEGYPDEPQTGRIIRGFENYANPGDPECYANVFHAGTKIRDGELVTGGGRVLTVVGQAGSYKAAKDLATRAVELISFEGAYHRTDIADEAIAAEEAK